jgi:hypothetical protein
VDAISKTKHLTDAERIDRLRLIRSDNGAARRCFAPSADLQRG